MLLSLGMLMLSATQIYTIFTVQLFAFLNLLPVEADITAFSFDNKTDTFDDLPARFGYRLPSDGLKGFLIGARPENACEPIEPPPKENLTGNFIVLIKRFECNFDIKRARVCTSCGLGFFEVVWSPSLVTFLGGGERAGQETLYPFPPPLIHEHPLLFSPISSFAE
uniref:Ring finger protein 13 n=1 Tax=Astatotilapia calliptera TaxID=8154 RepID=A0AAX7VA38_ASTCA